MMKNLNLAEARRQKKYRTPFKFRVMIVLETAEMKGKDLILKGKCQHCGKDVCRVVEPENE